MRKLAAHFLGLAEKQKATCSTDGRASPHGHFFAVVRATSRKGGRTSIKQSRFTTPREHRPLATRFGQDVRVAILCFRSLALWLLGYPDAALADASKRLRTRARSVKPLLDVCVGPRQMLTSTVEITRQQTRSSTNLSLLADEKGACLLESCRNV